MEKVIFCKLQWSPGHFKIPGNIEAHRLVLLVTRLEAIPFALKNSIPLFSIVKHRAGILGPELDPKTLFGQTKIKKFIKFF